MFKKKLHKVISALTTIQSDLKEVVDDSRAEVQAINKDITSLEVKRGKANLVRDEALVILGNVNTLLGK